MNFHFNSHQKAINAIKNGYFKTGILPINVEEVYLDEKGKKQKRNYTVDTDEGPRADTSMEALAKLKPAFAAGGCVTAGNSSQTSDGAAFVIVMGEKMMNELGLKPIGRLVTCAVCRCASAHYGYWACCSHSKSVEAGQHESFAN